MDRRNFIAGCVGLSLAAKAGVALGQANPLTKVVFPFSAGGGGDTLCRLVAEYAGQLLNRNVIVENRTGGDGLIGIKWVKNASPDGSTALVTTGPTMYLLPMVETEPSFDLNKDFVPVSLLARFEFGIAVGPAVDAKDFTQFVAWLKAHPGQATFGVPSNGTIPHFTGSKLEQVLGIPMTRVAYRGSAPDHQRPARRPSAVRHRHHRRCDAATPGRRHQDLGGEQRRAFAVPARCADLKGERRRSGRRRLVRDVAAGRQFAGVCQAVQRGDRHLARQARCAGEAVGDRTDSGRARRRKVSLRRSRPTSRSGSRSSRPPATRSRIRARPSTNFFRHGRARPGHPGLSCARAAQTWMPGTGPRLSGWILMDEAHGVDFIRSWTSASVPGHEWRSAPCAHHNTVFRENSEACSLASVRRACGRTWRRCAGATAVDQGPVRGVAVRAAFGGG